MMNASRKLTLAAIIYCWLISQQIMAQPIDEHGHEHGAEHAEQAQAKTPDAGDHAGHGDDESSHDEHGHAEHGEAEEGHADTVTLSDEMIRQFGIRLETVRLRLLSEVFQVPARITYNAEAMAHIGTPVEGRVKELKVRLGDQVQAGDVLLLIDSPALGEKQSEFLQKRAGMEVAQIANEVAEIEYQRASKLLEGKGISQAEFLKREGEFKKAQGELLAANAAATAAENNLHLFGMNQTAVAELLKTGEIDPVYTVRAPLSGEVIQREATLGEVVGPDKEALMIVADLSKLWAIASIPEKRQHELRIGSTTTLTLQSNPEQLLVGKLTYIAPVVDETTRAAQARIEFPNDERLFRPGMFARAFIESTAATQSQVVLAIPISAVYQVEGAPAVFVPEPGTPNTFSKRALKLGTPMGNMIPVLSGLRAGEEFVASGAFILKAEMGKAGAAHDH